LAKRAQRVLFLRRSLACVPQDRPPARRPQLSAAAAAVWSVNTTREFTAIPDRASMIDPGPSCARRLRGPTRSDWGTRSRWT
jgi:hypothetical protein